MVQAMAVAVESWAQCTAYGTKTWTDLPIIEGAQPLGRSGPRLSHGCQRAEKLIGAVLPTPAG